MNVAKRLGLESLPSVKVMAERLQCTHLPSAKNEATNTLYKITKPICISSSLGVEQPDCTPVAQPDNQWEKSRDQRWTNWSRGRARIVVNQLLGLIEDEQNPPKQARNSSFVRH